MRKTKKPILVTGSHRSATTWVGQVLAASPKTAYILEPFNNRIESGIIKTISTNMFQYICEENSEPYEEILAQVFHYKYPLCRNLEKVKTVRNVAKIIRAQGLSFLHRIRKDIPIIKDPIALFSAEWLCKTFDMNVLVMIRHPAAFCSSLKIKGWTFDFNDFLNQPLLMTRYLDVYEEEIREYAKNEKDIIDQAILVWNCIYHTVCLFQEKYSEWLFIKHEDLSLDPVNRFHSIYKAFDLEFTEEAKSFILETSGTHNPIEQQAVNEFIRDSKANIFNWKNRLSQNEIDNIKKKTSEVSSNFYAEHEW